MNKILLRAMMMAALTVCPKITDSISAQQRSISEMQRIAAEKLLGQDSNVNMAKDHVSTASVKLKAMSSQISEIATSKDEAFAVFTPASGKGFVIVSTNTQMPEVLACCDDASFETEKCGNPSLQFLLDSYVRASELISEGKATAEELFGTSSNIVTDASSDTKSPILDNIQWDQTEPYNILCPKLNGKYCATGCGPTSMAMLMKHYNYPAKGTGSVCYETETHHIPVSYDFSNTTFDWNNMQDTYAGYYEPNYVNFINDGKTYNLVFSGLLCGIYNSSEYPGYFELNNIFNLSKTSTLTGYIQLLILDKETKKFRQASQPIKIENLEYGKGYATGVIKPNFPSDLTDGKYAVCAAFTTDSVNYIPTLIEKDGFYNEYFIYVFKTGHKYTYLGSSYQAASNATEAEPIATLMAACGAASQADYGSTTSVFDVDMWRASNEYFGYDKDMYMLYSTMMSTDDMAKEAKRMLDADRIVPVGGISDKNSGHSFLIDGYDMTGTNPMFHINWGWSGMSNGNFLITQMNPSIAGTGGSSVNYSYKFDLIMNVIPEDNIDDGYAICCDSICIDKATLKPGEETSLGMNYTNMCLIDSITAPMYVYLVNNAGKAYKTESFIDRSADNPLKPLYGATFVWDKFSVPLAVPSGTYHVELRTSEKDHFFSKDNPIITVNDTPACVYLIDDDYNVIDSIERNNAYNLIPIIRTGYPWSNYINRYNGTATWTMTDEYGNVIKKGTHELKHDETQFGQEQIDSLDIIPGIQFLGKKLIFTVTFPDNSTDSDTIKTYDGIARIIDVGGGVYASFSMSTTHGSTTHYYGLFHDLPPIEIDWSTGIMANATLGLKKPSYTTLEDDKIAKSMTVDVSFTDYYDAALDPIKHTKPYSKILNIIKDVACFEKSAVKSEDFMTWQVPYPGEYKYNYSITMDGCKIEEACDSGRVIFTCKPDIACMSSNATLIESKTSYPVFTIDDDKDIITEVNVFSGYPYNVEDWSNRDKEIYAYKNSTKALEKVETISIHLNASEETSKKEYQTVASKTLHCLSYYGTDKLILGIPVSDAENNIDTLLVVKKKTPSGINTVPDAESTTLSDNGLFTLGGIFIGTDAANLPKGIYIQGRKKIIKQ